MNIIIADPINIAIIKAINIAATRYRMCGPRTRDRPHPTSDFIVLIVVVVKLKD
ncbi:hypothetical protein C900_00309 [Fulvivirga imtechensis AK7]|uniref:Uncharacterized protein n=1 Tax=Fulvivirga imtechensis AK7 TaxID=1237149 RepID=L8JI26_9BACT|nr:hypothetical protein C900_00309 [Fulvivirga imtechensis AK7]